MAWFSLVRRNSDRENNNSATPGTRRRWFRRNSNDDVPFFEIICDMRIATVFLNLFNISFNIIILVLRYVSWEMEWGHMVPSMLLSIMGIVGATRVNLTLTYISTIGFAVLAFIYGMVFYLIGLIVAALIVLSQMLLICEMMEGIVTKQDDALLRKEGSEVIEAVKRVASDVV